MKRRPNQVASIVPVSSSRTAIVRWIRRRNDGSTRTSATRTRAQTTVPSSTHDELAELAHLAQVVVAARQVEQQLADREEAEPPAGPLEEVRGREAGAAELVSRSSAGSVGGGGELRRAAGFDRAARRAVPATPYSAEIR